MSGTSDRALEDKSGPERSILPALSSPTRPENRLREVRTAPYPSHPPIHPDPQHAENTLLRHSDRPVDGQPISGSPRWRHERHTISYAPFHKLRQPISDRRRLFKTFCVHSLIQHASESENLLPHPTLLRPASRDFPREKYEVTFFLFIFQILLQVLLKHLIA